MTKNSINATTPAEGERRALRGYVGQYEKAGAAIYAALERDQLRWVGVADRSAGIADDLVLGLDGLVVGHQFKISKFPGTFTVRTILTGADGLLKPLIHAWQCLSKDNPEARVEIRLVVNDIPSVNDKLGDASPPHSAAFLDEYERFPNRSLQEWRASGWGCLVDQLQRASGLNEAEFERFLHCLRVVHGAAADFVQFHKLSAEQSRLASEIARTLPKLVTDARDKNRWSRDELLQELGWRDPAKTLHIHRFPVGAYVQRNRDTEMSLFEALRAVDQGYLALIGPPGSGKSTLLQVALATKPNIRLVRYLAYVPGAAQGVGRGEADSFLEDVDTQLRNGGLVGLRLRDNSLHERREQFGTLLKQAGERYERDEIRTIIVVDGLDHIPREERPTYSLLGELPLPAAIPTGVTFVLGTQRLDLAYMKPAVKEQAEKSDRLVRMRPLGREAVAGMADALALDPAISRLDVSDLSHGHPLATRYLIQALLRADDEGRKHLLAGGMAFDGDIESVYTSAWREIAGDSDAMDVLGFIARAEAPMPLQLLATLVAERAIERALVVARHLLRESSQGWSVFHNSFRLFVIAQPRIRLGSIDAEYSKRVYRDLARLAKSAPPESSQRWLELRYRARAGDQDDVLTLATPDRFRQQLAAGRPVSEIHADIRLALFATRSTLDATVLTRILLCHDEVGRRETALEYADRLPLAMLAVGDIDAAVSFVQDFPGRGYEVVDALLERGDFDLAKELFEAFEPLSQLHTSKFQHHGDQHNVKEFGKWARRACHFRDAEQIQQSIDHLATEGMRQTPEAASEETIAAVKRHLRREAAEAMLLQHDGSDPEELCDRLGVTAEDRPYVMIHAGLAAHERGAFALFDAASQLPGFDEVPNGLRRAVALVAVRSGHHDLASAMFEKLIAPMVSMGDDDTDLSGLVDLVGAVMQHARLCTLLEKPLPDAMLSKHPPWQPLQKYTSKVGVLLGRVAKDQSTVSAVGVQMLARNAMGYVLRLSSKGGGDAYRIQQAVKALPVLACALLKVAAKCGESEYRAVLREIDDAIATSTLNGTWYLRRRLAVAAYRIDGDRAAAVARLDGLAGELQEDSPSEQLDGLADLAMSFAAVGDVERAKLVLATVPEQCLGYALPPKKDPQYAIWQDIMVLANGVDPGQRAQRVALLMRQVAGMMETEGSSAAHRLTMSLIDEAMQVGPRFGFDVSRSLADWDLISWPNRVDLLMIGMVRRRPETFMACATVWCGLCLPFYVEPYYRDPYHIGDFIDVAADAAGPGQIAELAQMLLDAIEVVSRAHERLALLQRLRAAVAKHGLESAKLDAAVERWSSEAPDPRHSYTPSKYDSEATLEELELAFEADGNELNYNAPYRFAELGQSAPLYLVQRMYERWDSLQSDACCRFLLVKRLAEAGDVEYARKLVLGYEQSKDPLSSWSSWSQWMGGGKFRYFEARRLLDGESMHPAAFENLVDSVTAGQENTQSLLTELDSILPVISATPDWPAIWSLLAEQMACTREFQIGKPFEPAAQPLSDEEILEELLHFALRLPVTEVQRHARNCVLKLAVQPAHGEAVFERVIRRLLGGNLDAPLQALQTLLVGELERLAPLLGPTVAALVSHRDFAVAEAAVLLANRWGIPVSVDAQPLPFFTN